MDTKKLTKELVDAFLCWHLPKSVCADGCTTTTEWPHPRYGTNLLTSVEAEQMVREVVLPKLDPKPCRACEVFGDGPCSPKAFEKMEDKVARAIHAEHNRHEGQDIPWASLHKFQRMKYRAKAFAALKALGIERGS